MKRETGVSVGVSVGMNRLGGGEEEGKHSHQFSVCVQGRPDIFHELRGTMNIGRYRLRRVKEPLFKGNRLSLNNKYPFYSKCKGKKGNVMFRLTAF